jgi:hypothetical protein
MQCSKGPRFQRKTAHCGGCRDLVSVDGRREELTVDEWTVESRLGDDKLFGGHGWTRAPRPMGARYASG